MKTADMKVVAIILAIALFFTIVTSNVVSVASVLLLTKEQPVSTDNNGGQPANNNTAPVNNGGSAAPVVNNGGSTTPAANNNGGTAAPSNSGTATPSGDNNTPAAPTETISKADALQKYTTVMNKAKADKPAYSKVEYQELPSDAASRQISKGSTMIGTLLNLVDTLGIMTSKEKAEASPEIKEAGSDMRWFPVNKQPKGCYLTDANAIKSCDYKENGDIATLTIVLNDEQNPEPMTEGSEAFVSNHGAMFAPLSKKDIDETINGGTVSAIVKNANYSLTYHDCTAIIEYNTKTNELISCTQYMNVSIQATAKVLISDVQIDKQELVNTMKAYDFKY